MVDLQSFIQNISEGVGVIDPRTSETNETSYLTATSLLMRDIEEIPCLIEPILPRTGIVAIAGASDTGKSALLRQMAIDVCTNNNFINFPINARYRRAIYVSTEDDETAVSYLLNKQNKELLLHPDELSELIFLFDTENLIDNLEKLLSEKPADLVVIDCFTDIYSRSMNQANEIRTFLTQFSQLANRYQCLVMFLHHTGKGRESDYPSKNNLLGSQAFEAKMRAVFELRNDLADDTKKHLCIVKGNYLPADFKKESYVLDFSENLVFRNTGDRCMFDLLVKNDDAKKEQYEKILSMKEAGYTYSQIAVELGYKSKGTISKIVNKFSVSTFPNPKETETETVDNVNVSKAFPMETMETNKETNDDNDDELPF
jgi:RecA-family ATPase